MLLTTAAYALWTATSWPASAPGTTKAAERAAADTAFLKLEVAFIWLSIPLFLVVPTARNPDVAACLAIPY